MSRTQDQYGLGIGRINSATVNTVPNGYATVNVTLNNQTIPGDNTNVVPVAMPYGHFCIPDDNVWSVNLNLQTSTYQSISISQIPALFDFWPINGMVKGEGATYSRNYSMQANNNGLHAKLSNGLGNSTATMLFGENIVKVLIDLISYLDSLSGWLQTFQQDYNDGINPFPNPIPPTTTIDQDKTSLAAGKGYINDSGEPM